MATRILLGIFFLQNQMALLCSFIGFVVPFYWLYYCTLIVFTMHQYVFDCSFDDKSLRGCFAL